VKEVQHRNFLGKLKKHIIQGDEVTGDSKGTTVFLNSCVSGKPAHGKDSMNFLQYLAFKLAGARVYASQITLTDSMIKSMGNKSFGVDTQGTWYGSGKGKGFFASVEIPAEMVTDGWHMRTNQFCDDKRLKPRVTTLQDCYAACKENVHCAAITYYDKGTGGEGTESESEGDDTLEKCFLSHLCSAEDPNREKKVKTPVDHPQCGCKDTTQSALGATVFRKSEMALMEAVGQGFMKTVSNFWKRGSGKLPAYLKKATSGEDNALADVAQEIARDAV